MIKRFKLLMATCTLFGAAIWMSPFEFKIPWGSPAIAQSALQADEISITALERAVSQQGKWPEDVNEAMRSRFARSAFPYYEPADGCSTPWYVDDEGWDEIFSDACDNHDICYTIPGNAQQDCDSQMFREMLVVCENVGLYWRITCPASANMYYGVIRQFGQGSYNTAQRQQIEYSKAIYAWLAAD
jgi:hypothetical protein